MAKALDRRYLDLTTLEDTEGGRVIAAHLARFVTLKEEAKAMNKMIAESRGVIRDFMVANALEGIVSRDDAVLLNIKDVPKLDGSAFKLANPALHEEFTRVLPDVVEIKPTSNLENAEIYAPGEMGKRLLVRNIPARPEGECDDIVSFVGFLKLVADAEKAAE